MWARLKALIKRTSSKLVLFCQKTPQEDDDDAGDNECGKEISYVPILPWKNLCSLQHRTKRFNRYLCEHPASSNLPRIIFRHVYCYCLHPLDSIVDSQATMKMSLWFRPSRPCHLGKGLVEAGEKRDWVAVTPARPTIIVDISGREEAAHYKAVSCCHND